MDSLLVKSIISLGATGAFAAGILFIIAKKFYVFEDPKIDEVDEVLPGANCGACGFAGCRNFAEATVKHKDLSNLHCPVGGNDCMSAVASLLGLEATEQEPMIAVLRCNGSKQNAPAKVNYEGAASCKSAHSMFAGTSGCAYGCLGLGDCAVVCDFDALYVDEKTGLPVVDEVKCAACGACVKACPRDIFEMRPKGKDSKRVFVACMNKEKGGPAKKNCSVACIGCQKCKKVCDSETVTITNFLSYIDPTTDVNTQGAKLVDCCPTNAIIGVNVEPLKAEENNEA